MSDEAAWDARYSDDTRHIELIRNSLPDLISRSATIRAILALPLDTAHVLEIGCGTGQHSTALARERPNWIFDAIDTSAQAVSAAQVLALSTRAPITVQRGNATQLPFPDASFDIVFGDHVIGHILDQDAAFAEIARVLRPEGYVLLNAGNALRFDGWPLYHALTHKQYLARAMFPWTLSRLARRHGCRRITSFGSVLVLTRGLSLLVPSRRHASVERGVKTGTVTIAAHNPGFLRRLYRWCDTHAPAWLKTDYGIIAQKRG